MYIVGKSYRVFTDTYRGDLWKDFRDILYREEYNDFDEALAALHVLTINSSGLRIWTIRSSESEKLSERAYNEYIVPLLENYASPEEIEATAVKYNVFGGQHE